MNKPKNLFQKVFIVGAIVLLTLLLWIAVKTRLFVRVSNEIQAARFGEVSLEKGTYHGELSIGFPQGEGTLQFLTGETYSGNWDGNIINGIGKLDYPDSGIFEGNFEDGLKCGYGTYTWASGDEYEGNWFADQMSGEGVYTFVDGGILSGVFSENQFYSGRYDYQNSSVSFHIQIEEGKTKKITAAIESGVTYEGDFPEYQIAGYGEMVYPNGDIYSGEYSDGVRCGTGTYTWGIGDCYVGSWSSDTMDGNGTYTYSSGETLQGAFLAGSFLAGKYVTKDQVGRYSFTIENGKTISAVLAFDNGLLYEGDFDGKYISGQGVITYSNGDHYIGSFENGLRDGQGVYTWNTGEKYDGNWVNDRMEGIGIYYYSSSDSGLKLSGFFLNGLPEGDCQYFLTESLSYKTSWKNGKCMKVYE